MAKQQISKDAREGNSGAADRPADADERQTRRRLRGRARAATAREGASALPEAIVDRSAISTGSEKGDAGGATSRPDRAERQTRRRRPRGRAAAAEARKGASAGVAMPPEAIVAGSAMLTGSKTTGRAASPPRARAERAGAPTVSGAHRAPASTKRAVLIGMLERAEGASVAEIGQRLGWLPHTVRAAITGLRHAGREVTRNRNQNGPSTYRLGPVETNDR
jgi:Protein of unknown function (DUF3489)